MERYLFLSLNSVLQYVPPSPLTKIYFFQSVKRYPTIVDTSVICKSQSVSRCCQGNSEKVKSSLCPAIQCQLGLRIETRLLSRMERRCVPDRTLRVKVPVPDRHPPFETAYVM